VLREATSISKVPPSSDTCDNTLKNVGRRARNSHDGSTGGALGLHDVVMCSYSLTKQNKLKRSTGQPSLEGSQRGRPRRPTWLEFRCTQSLRGVGIPPKAITFPLIYVVTCVKVLREATSISEVSLSSDTCDNTLENVGRRAGNSHDRSTGGALGLHGVVMCSYSLTEMTYHAHRNDLSRSRLHDF
jgi:hypothetical protein